MTDATSPGAPPPHDGAMTAEGGSPVAVDVSGDRPARVVWVVFLGGPVIWISYFMLVYLVAEAGCTGGGPGLRAFNPPVPRAVTLIATAVAALGCLGFALWAYRRLVAAGRGAATAGEPGEVSPSSEERDRTATLAFAGFLLALFSFVAVLFVGVPAFVLGC